MQHLPSTHCKAYAPRGRKVKTRIWQLPYGLWVCLWRLWGWMFSLNRFIKLIDHFIMKLNYKLCIQIFVRKFKNNCFENERNLYHNWARSRNHLFFFECNAEYRVYLGICVLCHLYIHDYLLYCWRRPLLGQQKYWC